MVWVVVSIIALIAAGILFLVWKMSRSRKLSGASVSRIKGLLDKTNRIGDPVLRILEYDKILDQLLFELGFKGNTADKLKKGGARFKNTQTLWTYHKLRNTIAHEHGAAAGVRDADGFRDALMQALAGVSK